MASLESGGLSAQLSFATPADVVTSADGLTLYEAGVDGKIRVYDIPTRTLKHVWDVGSKLGGIDLSPDGSYLVVAEHEVLGARSEGQYGPYYSTSRAYRVDTASGAVDAYSIEVSGERTFHDVAILGDGTVLITQNAYSAHLPLWTLDLATGEYTASRDTYSQGALLTLSEERSRALLTENVSDAPIHVYRQGYGVVRSHEDYEHGVTGYNRGIQAISISGGLIAQNASSSLYIYDSLLNFKFDLDRMHSGEYLGSNLAGMQFDESGDNLFILHAISDAIIQVSTEDWNIVKKIPVGFDVGDPQVGAFGNRLLLGNDGTFIVSTGVGTRIVHDVDFDNEFIGTVDADTLFSGAGNDAVSGMAGDDMIQGGLGNDVLLGGLGNDRLEGDAGADSLDGGVGVDAMHGGAGSDRYHVDNARDRVVEGVTGNTDVVMASVSYRLANGSQVEQLVAVDPAARTAIDLTGNEFANLITGNAGRNVIDGGGGLDRLRGGEGNDTYILRDRADAIVEQLQEGADSVRAYVNYTLASHVEELRLLGEARIGTGNALANLIVGTGGQDSLKGLGGSDMLSGGGDIDLLMGGAEGDTLNGGAGGDTLRGEDGNDRLFGDAALDMLLGGLGDDRLDGGVANDTLSGGDGRDSLLGRAGRDTMTGGGEADTFMFDDGETVALISQADQIVDFSHAAGDKIHLRAIDAKAGTGADDNFTFIGTNAFAADGVGGQLRYQVAGGNTFIQGDTDGDGAANFFIRLDGTAPLVAADFTL